MIRASDHQTTASFQVPCFTKTPAISTTPDIVRVHSVESFGTHDGPGLRMVVFLQGCNLKCAYCHNPDTIAMDGGMECTVEQLVAMAVKMKPYFGKKGGVTVSGGEPLLQARALIPVFKRLNEEGIHTAIDTNGRILNSFTRQLLDEYTDLVMLDIKHMTEAGYRALTGRRNKETTFTFAKHREASGKKMWLRYLLIPGRTGAPEILHEMGSYFTEYQTIERLEIQPYHHLGVHKWEALGWEYPLKEVRENTPEELDTAVSILKNYFKEVTIN